jgi:hypothetical protein
MNKVKAVNAQLKQHHGYYFKKWRKGLHDWARDV